MSMTLPTVDRVSSDRPLPSGLLGPLSSRVAKTSPQVRPQYESGQLLQGAKEALIEHGGEIYRLRLTGSGKLYLTK